MVCVCACMFLSVSACIPIYLKFPCTQMSMHPWVNTLDGFEPLDARKKDFGMIAFLLFKWSLKGTPSVLSTACCFGKVGTFFMRLCMI